MIDDDQTLVGVITSTECLLATDPGPVGAAACGWRVAHDPDSLRECPVRVQEPARPALPARQ